MSYITSPTSVAAIMAKVLVALLPGIVAYVWYFGPAILVTLLIATLAALAFEALALRLRKVPLMPYLSDWSAVVTAWLLALSIPPLAPCWLTVTGVGFAILVAKQLYGGTGNNLFNPAMAGFAALLVSFPVKMSQWPPPLKMAATRVDFSSLLGYILKGIVSRPVWIDAETMATPLDVLKTRLATQHTVSDILTAPVFGYLGGQGVEVIALGYLAGGLYLMQQKVITWHMPVAYLGALAVTATAFQFGDSSRYAPPLLHILTGGAMLGAFFIVTDPVTGATTPRGKLVFAAGAGLLTYIVRAFGDYVDGVAFAVLFMNMCVPLIDAYTQPPVFGKKAGRLNVPGNNKT
jgi:electron transport complex protein RnfD